MPTFRKVSPEVAQTWSSALTPTTRVADDRYTWVERPAMIFLSGKPRPLSETPRVGDVLRLRGPAGSAPERVTGIVLEVRTRQDGTWTHALLAVNGGMQWASKSSIVEHLGRIKGITRVDQPTKMLNNRLHGGTHGWFVRVYAGKSPQLARTFSDMSAGGKVESLKAALAFHAAHVGLSHDDAIPFP